MKKSLNVLSKILVKKKVSRNKFQLMEMPTISYQTYWIKTFTKSTYSWLDIQRKPTWSSTFLNKEITYTTPCLITLNPNATSADLIHECQFTYKNSKQSNTYPWDLCVWQVFARKLYSTTTLILLYKSKNNSFWKSSLKRYFQTVFGNFAYFWKNQNLWKFWPSHFSLLMLKIINLLKIYL